MINDTMGRRATKKVTTNGTLTEHRRFLYRGYLQIACCDLTRAYTPALWFITWDPTQETATRPLAIQKNGTWYTYGWDLTKNICETYRTDARIDLAYTYTPYGEVSPAHAYDQPLRWSSEYHDTELGLVYYNYRHYNPVMGRWMGRDFIHEYRGINLYKFINNSTQNSIDFIGDESYTFDAIHCSISMIATIRANFINEREKKWNLESITAYKSNLKASIETIYNNNSFLLRSSNSKCPCSSGISISLTLKYVESFWDFADWNISIYADFASDPIFHPEVGKNRHESSSVGFPSWGRLYSDSYMKRIAQYWTHSDGSLEPIRVDHVPAAHEFGHALGLDHPGRGVRDTNGMRIAKNSPEEYRYVGPDCYGRQVNGEKDIMGVGAGVQQFYYDSWKHYINNEHCNCDYHF